MLDRNIDNYPDHHKETWARARKRHPGKSTAGALFAEITSVSSSTQNRERAADLFRCMAYKRGLRAFDRIAAEFCEKAVANVEEPCGFPNGVERYFYGSVLFCIARIDSPESHAVLVRYATTVENPHLRADVLEAMAFEGNEFDVEFVYGVLKRDTNQPVILSAIYALDMQYSKINRKKLRKRVAPFLKHDNPHVRYFAINALCQHPENRKLIQQMLDDPEPTVRQVAKDGLRLMDWFSGDTE